MLVISRIIFLISLFFAISDISEAGILITGRIMQVKDGDTVVVAPDTAGRFFTCNLYGIDAPEIPKRGMPGQNFGLEAMLELEKLVSNQITEIIILRGKPYKKNVCIINREGTIINLEMVRRGYAWVDRRYLTGPYIGEFISAEAEAKIKRIGLWQDINPQPPWEYRRWGRRW